MRDLISEVPKKHEGTACPKCGAFRVHRSHRRGVAERLLAILGARIRRCHACNVRFARLASSTIYIDDAGRALRRIAVVLLMLIGLLFVLFTVRWMMGKEEAYPQSEGAIQIHAGAQRA